MEAEPSEKEKQLVLGQRKGEFEFEVVVEGRLLWLGRFRVPMRTVGWFKGFRVLRLVGSEGVFWFSSDGRGFGFGFEGERGVKLRDDAPVSGRHR